ncbi:MAG: single-stranded DNA-binding protein [Anaerolineae bacterium]
MFHRVILLGNLGGDPVMRYTPNGTPVTNFNVATNERWVDQSGETQERTTWWRVTVWGKQAEICNEYLSKGRQVLVEGTLVADPNTGGPRIWTDQNGNPRASFEVRARVVRFVGGRGEAPGVEAGVELPESEEDLPF